MKSPTVHCRAAGPAPSLHTSYAKDKMGRNTCRIPSKSFAIPRRGQKSSCRRIWYFAVTVGTAQEGSALITVPACWDLCKVTVRDNHCPEEHVVLVSVAEVAAVMGKSLEEDVISIHESDPVLSLQLAESCRKEAWGVRKTNWPARAPLPLISLIL